MAMTEMIVHGVPGSPYVRSALLALEEKGAAYRLAAMGMGDGKSAAHLARHPFGRMPVIEHGDFQLYETDAILRYLDAALPGPALRPTDLRQAARCDQVCGIVDWYLFPQATAIIGWQRIIVPMMGGKADEAAIAAAVPATRTVFGVLNGILGDKPFLAGGAVSIADLMAVPQLDYLAQTPEGADLLAGSALLGWLDRMRARPSLIATTPERLQQAA
jgi:glutathione S-transferase